MRHLRSTIILTAAMLFALTACASDTGSGAPPTPGADSVAQEPTGPEQTDETDAAGAAQETTIPAGARAASSEFPFPVPEGWAELEAFAEEKIGKSLAWTAAFEYPGEAEVAASVYESLLIDGGFQVQPDPLGSTVNLAAFLVEGAIAGEQYRGGIGFDTYADGHQKARITLERQ